MTLLLPQLNCTLCPLHQQATKPGVPTTLLPSSLPPSPSTPAIVFLGQNPGHVEDRVGQPFIGPSGLLVRNLFIPSFSLASSATIYLANAARCHTTDDAPPRASHLKACMLNHGLADLTYLAASHCSLDVICLGSAAITGISKLFSVKLTLAAARRSPRRFLKHPSSPLSILLSATFHPAFLLRAPHMQRAAKQDLLLFSAAFHDALPAITQPHLIPARPPSPS